MRRGQFGGGCKPRAPRPWPTEADTDQELAASRAAFGRGDAFLGTLRAGVLVFLARLAAGAGDSSAAASSTGFGSASTSGGLAAGAVFGTARPGNFAPSASLSSTPELTSM